MNNEVNTYQATPPKMQLSELIHSQVVRKRIDNLLGERAGDFVASLMAAVNNDKKLQDCENMSILTAALTAAGLNLPVNQNLGFAYLIPYKEGRTGVSYCQFQMGYKGYIQLAMRTGYYKTINVVEVREGEKGEEDRLSGEISFNWIEDEVERLKRPVIGYVAYFRLLTGFEKMLYWSSEKALKHGKKYSKVFAKYNSGLWREDFDGMAKKTVLKKLLSQFGPMSTELQAAIANDQTVDGRYVDNPNRVNVVEAKMGTSEEDRTGEVVPSC